MNSELQPNPAMSLLSEMLDPPYPSITAEIAESVDIGDLPDRECRALFEIIAAQIPCGGTVATIRAEVQATAAYASEVYEQLVDCSYRDYSASWPMLVRTLRAWSRNKRLRASIQQAQSSIDSGLESDVVRQRLDEQLTALDMSALGERHFDDKKDMVRRIHEFMDGKTRDGLPFGYSTMDNAITPLMAGNFAIVAGRPGTGKSTLLRNFTYNWLRGVGTRPPEPTAYLSFEMAGDEKLPLLACMRAGLDYKKFVRKQFDKMENARFHDALDWWVGNKEFKLNERSDVSPDWILRTLKRYRAQGFTTFVLDHFHRVCYDTTGKGEIRLPMAAFARQLKSFANDYECRVVAGAQFTKGDKHVEPSDDMIREVANVIDEADKILLTWQPYVAGTEYPDGTFSPIVEKNGQRLFPDDAPKGSQKGIDRTVTFVKIGKMRAKDRDGVIQLAFNPDTGLIADVDEPRSLGVAA